MKATITIDIENAQIGHTVIETFATLTEDQRLELCKQVMLEWLKQPWEIEKSLREQMAIDAHRKKYATSSFGSSRKTEEEIRKDYYFPSLLAEQKTSRETMIEAMRAEIHRHVKKSVVAMVESDEGVAKLKAEAMQQIRDQFPGMVQTAMVDFFKQHMYDVAREVKNPV